MSYRIGQEIVFLHDVGGGIVREVQNERVRVEDGDGFSNWYSIRDVAPVLGDLANSKVVRKDDSPKPKRNKKPLSRDSFREIDLHIEVLVEDHAHMTNTEIIHKQLFALRQFMQQALCDRIRRVVIIHGVGEGVLREEVHVYLKGLDTLEIRHANHHEYGWGATEVILRQNARY